MRFQELEAEWDDENVEHIAKHGVEPEEVEEIVYEAAIPRGSSAGAVAESVKCGGQFSGKRAPAGI